MQHRVAHRLGGCTTKEVTESAVYSKACELIANRPAVQSIDLLCRSQTIQAAHQAPALSGISSAHLMNLKAQAL
jgi:hypothetical protein